MTGAGRGIGAALAAQLADHGYTVWVTARDLESAEGTAAAIRSAGHRAHTLQIDLDDPASLADAATALDGIQLDLLVNNAARFADWSETATTTDLDTARAVTSTNLFGS